MFHEYNVNIGISIDGPAELNDARWNGSLERTRETTARVEATIEKLCRIGIPPGLIVTLTRCNASADRLPILAKWMERLDQLGIRSVRLHVLEVEDEAVRTKYGLSISENVTALLTVEKLQLAHLRFDLFKDMHNMLMGWDEQTTCVWTGCDPYTTRAVRGIEGDGSRTNCTRTNKDGVDFLKSADEGYERYLALYATPQRAGGCAGCRFFLMCKGQCPGTAIDGDWRNRSEQCEIWKAVYTVLERRILEAGGSPLSVSATLPALEAHFVNSWRRGETTSMMAAVRFPRHRTSRQ